MDRSYIIDFDSTITQVEALEELGAISLKSNPKKKKVLDEIKALTDLGMEGKISIEESLAKRLSLLAANKKHLERLVLTLKKKISPSFRRNKAFFKKYKENIYVISAGFREFILPVVRELGILERNVHANTFEYDAQGNIIGIDKSNPLSGKGGKGMVLRSLDLPHEIFVIGDGYTDFEMKETGLVSKFFAFTETIERKSVVEKADHVVSSFDEFLYINRIPASLSYPKSRMKVLLLENIHAHAVQAFRDEGFHVEEIPSSIDEQELCRRIKGVSLLGIRSKTEITRKVVESADRLLAIGAFCIGTNQIDLKPCTQKGIAVFNAPYSNTRSVVELVVGEMILLLRGVVDKSNKLHAGVWEKSAKNSNEIRGKTLGIVGYGNIGTQLGVIAEALGMHVLYFDVVEKLALGNAKKCETLHSLLQKSDVVTVHVDGNPKNRNLIGEKEFKAMKEGAVFLNLSRGSVVDIKALRESLRSAKLRGAAIDVYPIEPKGNGEKFSSELQGIPNAIITPHIGGSTQEAQRNIAHFVSSNLLGFVNSGNTFSSVNVPQLQLQELKGAHRFIHVHSNVPGILAKINAILAKHKANILGQYLKTLDDVGYVITDVSKKYDRKVIGDLRRIEHTIRFRVLY